VITYLDQVDYLFFPAANASYSTKWQPVVVNLFRQDDERAILQAWKIAEYLGLTHMLPHNPHPVAVELWKKYLLGKNPSEFDQELPICIYDYTDPDIVSYIVGNDLYHARLHTNPSDVVVDWLITHHSTRLSRSVCQNKNERMIEFLISQDRHDIDVSSSPYPPAVEHTKKKIESGWIGWSWVVMCPEVLVWLYNRLQQNGTLDERVSACSVFAVIGGCRYLSVVKQNVS
jgi:hypothetical protein